MNDGSQTPEDSRTGGDRLDPEIAPAPLWVKVLGVVTGLLLLIVAVLHLTGNSLGGPGSHGMPNGETHAKPHQP